MSKYEEHVNNYDFYFLRYPVPLKDIATFANRNNVSINVYGCTNYKDRSNEDIEPRKQSKQYSSTKGFAVK